MKDLQLAPGRKESVTLLSAGSGPERYSLRFAVDLTHEAAFTTGSDAPAVQLEFFGKEVQLQAAPFGVMIFASDFASEAEAKSFGDRLRLACQFLSVQKSVSISTDREPTPIFDTPWLLENLEAGAREVDGRALQMSYAIIPEHQVIMSCGELRGNLTRLVSPAYFLEAFRSIESRKPKENFAFNEAIDTACDFWSIACLRHGEVVHTVNVVAALEVLAAGVGVRGTRQVAVRELLEMYWPETLQVSDLPEGHSISSFCKELFKRRNELVHTGHSTKTSFEVSNFAESLCRELILAFSQRSYFEPNNGGQVSVTGSGSLI